MSRVSCATLMRLLLGQVIQRPHVVQAIGELDDNDPDVVDHREEHLPEVLGLPLLARRERDRADLGDALDDVRHGRAEELLDAIDGRQRVFDHVVEEPGGYGDRVELHVREEVGDGQRMDQVGFAGMADLPPVLECREDIGASAAARRPPLASRPGPFREDPRSESWIPVSNSYGPGGPHGRPWGPKSVACDSAGRLVIHHRNEAVMPASMGQISAHPYLDLAFLGSLYWPGFGHGNFLALASDPDGGFPHELTASFIRRIRTCRETA